MKVCLIQPPYILKLLSTATHTCPPLGLAYIASVLREAGHNVSLIDGPGEKPDQYTSFKRGYAYRGLTFEEIAERIPEDVQVIGLSIMFTMNWPSNKLLFKHLNKKFPNAIYVAGGEHVTALPELCLEEMDFLGYCVLGEGEETMVDLLDAIEKGRNPNEVEGIVFRSNDQFITTPRRSRKKNIDELPWPAWDLVPVSTYQENKYSFGVYRGYSMPLLASRGCPFSCTFCSSPEMWTTRYYLRSTKDLVDEMEFYHKKYRAVNFDFYDLTAFIKREWIIEFAQEIINRGLKITYQLPSGTRSEGIDREVAHYIYKSGCRNITYAPESGSPEILQMIKKKVKIPNMLDSIYHSYKENLNIKLNMIIGFPGETHKNVWESVWFLIKTSWYGAHDATPVIFTPYPGSYLFKQLHKAGKLDLKDENYYFGLLGQETFLDFKVYNEKMKPGTIKFYLLLQMAVFYFTNFLFRPVRFFRTLKNLITEKHESKGEYALGEIIKRRKAKVSYSIAGESIESV